ncbi:hypothetical protein CH363_00995 [Leptospira haakeii]|uniref:Uncharacterized protein n=1 Tax=Leptospira haakeii TaxID=2023198 RepID=A0ABX4PN88_9LEPT|nr:hypothetical protein CH363_00995 [Leptospira haakeii]PKA20983.1 hypothetical protein CH377_00995 [Leptospira haakeii]
MGEIFSKKEDHFLLYVKKLVDFAYDKPKAKAEKLNKLENSVILDFSDLPLKTPFLPLFLLTRWAKCLVYVLKK